LLFGVETLSIHTAAMSGNSGVTYCNVYFIQLRLGKTWIFQVKLLSNT